MTSMSPRTTKKLEDLLTLQIELHEQLNRTELEIREELDHIREIAIPSKSPTAREREVLALVRQGLANKEIADRINITVRTVVFHVGSLMRKFKVQSRRQL